RRRHQSLAVLIESGVLAALREQLRAIGDLERILSRVALRSARPRDLATLRDGLAAAPRLRETIANLDSPLLHELIERLGEHQGTVHLLQAAVVERPPALLRDRRRLRRRTRRIAPAFHTRRSISRRTRNTRTYRDRHRDTQGRLQPRARLLHRIRQGPRRQGTRALHPPPDHQERRALHHRG